MSKALKILFVASEALPLVKTGGLGDVAGSLPAALKALRHDVRIIMPAYREAMRKAEKLAFASFKMEGIPETVRLLEGRLPGTRVKLLLVDSPSHFDRPGGPYADPLGHDWADNPDRFALFAKVAVAVATNHAELDWQPDIVHGNDWQSGLVPALLSLYPKRPATVFTIHNLAYQGHFAPETFGHLHLPHELWGIHGLEFHGGLSFIKGGLSFADMISTVSPTYAKEIQTPAYGCGLEGLLNHRKDRLKGILNGVDYNHWNPAKDSYICANYDHRSLAKKALNKAALQKEFGLPVSAQAPLLGLVGRLVEQKGIDLILGILPRLVELGAQVALIGSGEKHFEEALTELAAIYPNHIATFIGYDEPKAHRIEAGADMFLMPSRFEPCGLNQIYSLRYGTIPIVRHTGGLADTVVDLNKETQSNGKATGIHFQHSTLEGLLWATERAIHLYRNEPELWRTMMVTGMQQDFSWKKSAREYVQLYQQALIQRDASTTP